ncbi:MAG: ATP-grasp domain-containing protein, partial [Calditrichaeota bacterium]
MDHRWVLWWITGKYLWSRMGHFLRSRLRGTDEFEQELAKENLILREAARKLGIEVIDHGGGMLEFRCGERRSFIKGNATELESAVAHRIAGDKFLVSRILAENGLPVPAGTCFTVDEVERAREYFHHAEKPLVVKPRRGTSGGLGVTAGIESWRDFRRAFFEAGMYDRYVLVERFVSGEHIRLLMIKDQLLSAVRRVPAFLIGDGRRSIRRLIQETNRRRAASQQFPRLWPIRINNDLKLTLRRQSLTLRSVPPAGQKVYVKTICNGHQGGIVEEVTRIIHP